MGIGDEDIQGLVVGLQPHDADVADQMRVVRLKLAHGLVVDQARVRIVDGAVARRRPTEEHQ